MRHIEPFSIHSPAELNKIRQHAERSITGSSSFDEPKSTGPQAIRLEFRTFFEEFELQNALNVAIRRSHHSAHQSDCQIEGFAKKSLAHPGDGKAYTARMRMHHPPSIHGITAQSLDSYRQCHYPASQPLKIRITWTRLLQKYCRPVRFSNSQQPLTSCQIQRTVSESLVDGRTLGGSIRHHQVHNRGLLIETARTARQQPRALESQLEVAVRHGHSSLTRTCE